MRTQRLDSAATLDAWMHGLSKGGDADPRLADAASDITDTLFGRPDGLTGAVRRFGALLGTDGWPFELVAQWFVALQPHVSRRQRQLLTDTSITTALAEGWADAFVRGSGSEQCIDPVTALGTALVLKLRLAEVYAQCRTLGVDVNDAFRLVVIEADVDDLGPFDRDAVMVTMASVCIDVFHAGETIVRCGNRIVVLTSASEGSEVREAVVEDRLRFAPITRVTHPLVWNDRLPESSDDIELFLRELVG